MSAALVLPALGQTNDCVVAPAGLVGWWRGESNLLDSAGTNNGVAVGGLTYGPGEVGQAFSLNGSNAFVEIPASASLDVGSGPGFTIEAWVRPNDVSVQRPMVEWNSGSGFGTHFWISVGNGLGNGPGCLFANIVDTTGAFHPLASAASLITTGAFTHVALTYDKTSGIATIYDNGAIVAQQDLGSFTPQTTYDLYLGERAPEGAPADWWFGQLDEVSVYGRALTATEIQSIYGAGSSGKCGNPANISLGLFPGVYIDGIVGNTYIVQSNPNLANMNGWTTVANVILQAPVQLWVDTNVNTALPTHPQYFYRVLTGP